WRTTLVEELQVARVDGHGLIRIGANQFAMTDVVGPSGAAVCLAGEGVALGCGLRRPRTVQAGGRERTEVSALRANRLDEHEVSVLALELVDLNPLEEVVGRVGHDRRVVRAEVPR